MSSIKEKLKSEIESIILYAKSFRVDDSDIQEMAEECVNITEEYKDKECIKFAEWIGKSGYESMSDNSWVKDYDLSMSTKQLLKLYKKSK